MSFLSDILGVFEHGRHPQEQAQPQQQVQQHSAPMLPTKITPEQLSGYQGPHDYPIDRQQSRPQVMAPPSPYAASNFPFDLTFSRPGLPNFEQSLTSPQGAIRPQVQSNINGYAQPSYPILPLQGTGRQVQPSWDNPNDFQNRNLTVY